MKTKYALAMVSGMLAATLMRAIFQIETGWCAFWWLAIFYAIFNCPNKT